jgi:hypothetical protein
MALPTLVNSYEFNTSWQHLASGNDGVDRQHLWFHLVDTMTSWATNPWTVVSSCNGTTAGSPGPGWNSIADVVRSPNVSWILLESVGGQQILFSLSSSFDRYGSIYFSPDGDLTGGTVSSLPLTGNYREMVVNKEIWMYSASKTTYTHLIHATNGELDCMFHTYDGKVWWNFFFGKVANPVAAFTQPWLMQSNGSYVGQTSSPKVIYDNGTSTGYGWGTANCFLGYLEPGGASSIGAFLMPEGVNNSFLASKLSTPSDITGAYGMFPLRVWSKETTKLGPLGTLNDIYHIPSLTMGTTLEENPAAPTLQWAVMGNFAFPWDGTVPVIG